MKLLNSKFLGILTVFFIFAYVVFPSKEVRQERHRLYCSGIKLYSQTNGEQGHPDYKGLRTYCED